MNAPGAGQRDTEPREPTVQLTLDFDVTRVPTAPRRRPATHKSTATAELDLDPAPLRVPRRRREPTPDPPVYTATYEYIGEPDTEAPGTPNTPNGTSSRHPPRHVNTQDTRDGGTKRAARHLAPHFSNGSQKPRRQPLANNRAPTQTPARAPPTRQSQYRRQGLSQLANSLPLRADESRFSVAFVEYVRPRRRYSAVSGIRSGDVWPSRSRQDRREVHAAWLALLAAQGATWRPARSSTDEGSTGPAAGR